MDNKIVRYMLGALSVAYIVFLWVKKDITGIYSTMPKEQLLPLIITSAAVTLIKISVIAAAVLLIRRFVSKMKDKD